jgi:hypothetical protein
MIELTKEQHQAIQRNGDRPPRVRDPETEITYVLLREDVYDRVKSLLTTEEFDPDEGLRLMNEVMAEDDAGDPLLESYQKYRKQV